MFRKEYKETPLDGGDNPPKKVTVTYKGEPCSRNGSRREQHELLSTIVNTVGLLDCGLQSFQTLKMYHDDTSWVLVLETTT